MTGHRWAGAIALGVALGLVWGATMGVIVSILVGYRTLTALTVSLPLGIVVVGLPAFFLTYRSIKRVPQPEPHQD